jgi:starvation-inducible DNA-binding protein
MAKLSSIDEEDGQPDWKDMVKNLAKGHEQVAKTARDVLRIAEDTGDDATADIVAPRVTLHEKTAWMLRATAA